MFLLPVEVPDFDYCRAFRELWNLHQWFPMFLHRDHDMRPGIIFVDAVNIALNMGLSAPHKKPKGEDKVGCGLWFQCCGQLASVQCTLLNYHKAIA